MEKITFEQIKDLIDQKGGKWIISTFQDEQDIYYLYDSGWTACDNYGHFGDETDPMQVLLSRGFDSPEQAMSEAEKIGFPVINGNSLPGDVNGENNLLKKEEIQNLVRNGEIQNYSVGIIKVPTWSDLELKYPEKDIPDPSALLDMIDNVIIDNAMNDTDKYFVFE